MNIILYGKLPTHGDFVARGVSPALKTSLDALLQSALALAVDNGLTEADFMASRPMAVNFRAGVLSDNGFLGLLAPSKDRVGRMFPICLGLEIAPEDSFGAFSTGYFDWPSIELVRALCLAFWHSCEAQESVDDLFRRCEFVIQQSTASGIMNSVIAVSDDTLPPLKSDATQFVLRGKPEDFPTPIRAMCATLPQRSALIGFQLDEAGAASNFFMVRDLLIWSHLAALFDGKWTYWGWSEFGPSAQNDSKCDGDGLDDDRTRPSRPTLEGS